MIDLHSILSEYHTLMTATSCKLIKDLGGEGNFNDRFVSRMYTRGIGLGTRKIIVYPSLRKGI